LAGSGQAFSRDAFRFIVGAPSGAMLLVMRRKSIAAEAAPTKEQTSGFTAGAPWPAIRLLKAAATLHVLCGSGFSRDAFRFSVGAPSGAMLFVMRRKSIAAEPAPTKKQTSRAY
jgi:hypothetical protein